MTDLSAPLAVDAMLRVPPHSIEAEQSVLGSLLLDATSFGRIVDVIDAADFFRHEHQVIFDAIARTVGCGDPLDPVTVFAQLEGEVIDFGGLPYLNALQQGVSSAANIRRYAEIVAERATLRAVIAHADMLAASAFAPKASAAAVLDTAMAHLGHIGSALAVKRQSVPLLSLAELQQANQGVRWCIKHTILAQSIGLIFGPSGAFKSFIAIDCALHVVHGLPWLGRRTTQGAVIYLAAEGGAGLWNRVLAWHRARNLRWQDAPLHVIPTAVDLRADAWRVVQAAQAAGVSPAMVVIDTLSQTLSGEENSATDMAAYLRELGTRFREHWNCSVLLVHHTGHVATERPRGSSALFANVDYAFGVFREEKEMLATLTCAKVKDGETFADATFSLTVHNLGTDEDGDKVTSLVARHLTSAEEISDAVDTEIEASRGGNHQLLLRLVQNGSPLAGLRKAFYEECGIPNPDNRRQAFHRSKTWAMKHGFIDIAQGLVVTLKKWNAP